VKRRLPEIVLVLVIAAFASWTLGCGSELPKDAVAKVGDTYITVQQFDAAVAQEATTYGITKDTYPDIYKELQKWVVGNLVANELALQEATKLGMSVNDAEVQTQADNYLNSYYSGDQAAMNKELETAGLTLEAFKKTIKDGLLRDKVKAQVVKDITSVPEEQIVAYYEANKTTYYVEPSRVLRHVLIKPVATGPATTTTSIAGSSGTGGTAAATLTDTDWAKALATAKEVRRKLVAGGDWTKLAAQYSGDPASKDKGGDLGTVVLGQTIKEFEDAAFALVLNEISQPVKTVYGYDIIQATAVTKGGQQTLAEVRGQIEPTLISKAQDEAWNKWLEQKKADAGVIYRSDLRPVPTTTTQATTTTTLAGPTTTSVSVETTTTAKP
jgi:parvulin-like peptidyl-prolyl isomerase